ncbi:hypothetical protein GPJ56_006724 [Histomonas meleagridis]|uniref:uncharacterized protein n=1 Tax=Histomonas meleagridis TaxID=135588 RepID=UPI003559DE8B|nr:hypothetical protein GPJ56_006724 [Histomonas meleagridis]KAH0805920.1 hypothetical protein GO595_001251 [Histomonas meleagridis]
MPQRSSLFSMPIVYSILCLLIIYGNSHQIDLKSFTLIGLLVSCLPQVQAHSIIALAQWGVIYVILTFPYRKIKTQFKTYVCNYGILSIVAIVFGVPQMIPLLERTSKTSGFMKIAPIWSDSPGKNYLTYWVNALGVFFIISMLGIFVLHNKQLKMYIAALGVFFAANFIWYQPWSLDNTKIFNAGWIPFAVALVSKVLVMIWDKKYIGKILALPLFVLCIASGALANVKAIGASYPLWAKNADVFGFAEFVKSTDPIAVWLTDSSHTNPVVTLGGRQTVLGNRGWIYSHGIDDSKRFYDIQRIMGDPDNVKLTDKYDVKYVAVDKQNNEFKFAPRSDSRNWKKIYESKIFVVYNRTK